MNIEGREPGVDNIDRGIEIGKTPQEQLLKLVYERIPEADIKHANHCVTVLKSRRDRIELMAPLLAIQAKRMWEEEVIPIARQEDGKIVMPTSTLKMLRRRLFISERDEDITNDQGDNLKHFSLGFSEEDQLTLTDMENVALLPQKQKNSLIAFYLHDRYHLYPRSELMQQLLLIQKQATDENGVQEDIKIFPQDFEHIRDFIDNFGNILALSRFPHDFFAAIIQDQINSSVNTTLKNIQISEPQKLEDIFKGNRQLQDEVFAQVQATLTGKIDEEDIDVINQIVIPTAQLLRFRFAIHDYALVTNRPKGMNSNYILVEPQSNIPPIRMNYGILSSVIYNLAKNAVKAVDTDMKERTGNHTFKRSPLYTRYGYPSTNFSMEPTKQLTGYSIGFEIKSSGDNLNIIVSDSGVGINTDQILKHATIIIKNRPGDITDLTSKFISRKTLETLANWANGKDFAPRALSLGQVWDLLALPRLSGFNAAGVEESSGLGLWGIAYLIEEKNGVLKATKRFDRGASFDVKIPY